MDITSKLTLIPTHAGVYLFKDTSNAIIYIGKAKSLRRRVSSYFKPTTDLKVRTLALEAKDIAYIQTKNEIEALLLEAQLIKEYSPKYNVLLKDGQPFLYLLFTEDSIPKLEIVRNKDKKGFYFGPFLQKTDARSVHNYLIKTFRLQWCNKKIPGGCLDYHLEICPGSCTGTFDLQDYLFRLTLARQVLEGKHQEFLKSLKKRIAEHNATLSFEKSRTLQGYLEHFEPIFTTLRTHFTEKKYAKATTLATAPVAYHPTPTTDYGRALQTLLQLPSTPQTVDCFDISHFQSNALVGSCVRFTNGVADKEKCRRFAIRTLTQQNDYAALQEIVIRRYRTTDDLPDLILIDGGKGQLNAVRHLFPHVQFISLAKREETLFSDQFPEGIKLDVKTDAGKLLIALRDYAHHFAITYHRTVRAKQRSHEYGKVNKRRTRTSQP